MTNCVDPDQLASEEANIWIYSVCKSRAYPGSAGPRLRHWSRLYIHFAVSFSAPWMTRDFIHFVWESCLNICPFCHINRGCGFLKHKKYRTHPKYTDRKAWRAVQTQISAVIRLSLDTAAYRVRLPALACDRAVVAHPLSMVLPGYSDFLHDTWLRNANMRVFDNVSILH